jgi:hypothetical protein
MAVLLFIVLGLLLLVLILIVVLAAARHGIGALAATRRGLARRRRTLWFRLRLGLGRLGLGGLRAGDEASKR